MRLRAVFLALAASYVRREKGRTLLTVLGIALGVAVLVSIDLANESAVASFRQTVESISGTADLTVRPGTGGLEGTLVGELARLPEVRSVSPLISGDALYRPPDGRPPRQMLFLGTDFLRSAEDEDAPVRDLTFRFEEGRGAASFLTDPEALLFTSRFVEREGLGAGDRVVLEIGGEEREFVVAGIIEEGGLAGVYGGDAVLTDVAVADHHLGREGLLDRIDVRLRPDADREALRQALPPNAVLEAPDAESLRAREMLAAFRFNLRSLGHLAIVVGAFLIYNTMSIAVVRRRTVIGTLRAIGVTRRAVRGTFLLEGALFGLAGSVIGIVAGVLLAMAMLETVATAISINFFETRPGTVTPAPSVILLGLLLGVGASLVAAIGPANQAAAIPPATAMRQGSENTGAGPFGWWRTALAGMFAAAGMVLLAMEPRTGLPVQGYAASLLFIAAFVAAARPFLGLLTIMLRRLYIRIFRAEGLLAVSATRAALGRSGIAICGLAVALGMAVSVTVMVSSFRDTVMAWMEDVLVADIYISPTGGPGSGTIPGSFADAVRGLDGVAAVDPYREREILLSGRTAHLAARDFSAVRFRNRVLDGRPAAEAMQQARERGEVLVSEPLALRHGIARGDTIRLPAPDGELALTAGAVYYDYSSERGFVTMDRSLYVEHFSDTRIDNMTVHLADGADREAVTEAIRQRAAMTDTVPPLLYRADEDLRGFALEAFDRTFAITWLLQTIAVLVAILGVAATLLAQILDRRHEIRTLRHLGASRPRVARVVVLEASLIGAAGLLLGVTLGLILSWILARVVMLQSFGWSIQYAVPWLSVIQIAGIVFAATLAAAALPAWEAVKGRGEDSR